MSRLLSIMACIVGGLVLLVCGLLVPAHLRAVNESVIEKAGGNTPTLIDRGVALASYNNLGAAQLLLQAALKEGVPGVQRLEQAVENLTSETPDLQIWGSPELLTLIPALTPPKDAGHAENFTEIVVRLQNRERVLEFLADSSVPAVRELLRFREATNAVLFPPSPSASGQALDAALATCGLLVEQGRLSTGLSNAVCMLAAQANRGADSQPLEQVLMDLMSVGQRLNWGQMVEFVRCIDDPETLRLSAGLARKAEGQLPVLFAAVQLSGNPAAVAGYLMNFSQTGMQDLGSSLRFGAGGVNELLRRNQRLYVSGLGARLGLDHCARAPWLALAVKWVLYLVSGFLVAMSMHFARPAVSVLERPLQVPGFHVAREILFALGFLLVVLLLSEPFLAQESQKVDFPFRLRLPMTGGVVPEGTSSVHTTLMNQLSLLTLLLFFVLQGLLYTASVFKLAEIRRQKVPSRMKLKLLENEDHLFDAGLYLGFVGTIISLILVSLGVIKPSLMAAYSSTSFGIIFVSIFKILHLRPARRRLLLEAEAGGYREPTGESLPQAIAVHL